MLDGFPFNGPIEMPIDTDAIDRLFMEYGMASSSWKREQVKEEIAEEMVSSVYRTGAPEPMDFPTGTPLLVALIDLHRETDDPEVLEHIEREMNTVHHEPLGIPEFDIQPFPYAQPSDLLECADRFLSPIPAPRYFRLRAFRELGAFEDEERLRGRESDGSAIEGLTDEEREYIEPILSI